MRADVAAVDVFAENLREPAARGAARRASGARHRSRACAPAASAPSSTTTGKLLEHDHGLPRRRATRSSRKAKDDAARARAASTRRARSRSATAPRGRETEALRARSSLDEAGVDGRRSSCRSTRPARACTRRRDVAREEFPDLDLTVRGAISIARRLQDPLAELVKIDPKAIGVGQYQHDVHQPLLAQEARRGRRELRQPRRRRAQHRERAAARATSPASASRSRRRSSLHRDEHGAFASRAQLLDVPGLGPEGVRAGGGLPAHPRRGEPARRERRAPRALRARRDDGDGSRRRAAAS